MNASTYAHAVHEKLGARGFAALSVPDDLTRRVALAAIRQEEWGRLAVVLVKPEAAADEAREPLIAALGAWVREVWRQGEDPCYLVAVFPFDGSVPEREAEAIKALRMDDPQQRWGVIPWVADLAVDLIDRHSGFPRVGNDVTLALTDVPRGRAEEAWAQVAGPQVGRRRLGINLGYVPATRFILAATVAYYLWVVMAGGGGLDVLSGPSSGALIKWGSNFSPLVFQGEQWRLFTHILLHGGILHIGLNMWALWQVGRHVELIYGSGRMSFIYVVAGVVGGIASAALRPGGVNSVGASGAILGLMGGLVYFALTIRGRAVDWRNLLAPVAINLFYGFFMGGLIDNYAHIGGFIGGFLAAFLAGVPGQRSAWRTGAMAAVGLLLLLVLAGVIRLPHLALF